MKLSLRILAILLATQGNVSADEYLPPRCEILPLPDNQVSFQLDGEEKFRWHFDQKYPRPFFYPLNGPSGVSLTRMGHPGAQNHDHHRSVWFAHAKLNDLDFWSENGGTKIRQKFWYRYQDGNVESVMASCLGWFDSDNRELMEQDVVAALRPVGKSDYVLEIQMEMRPGQGMTRVTLNKSNFGLLAVRVAKSISAYFGGGQLTSSEGMSGEPDIFGKQARWMDYSGPIAAGTGKGRRVKIEGITFFDHPQNPRYPTRWHVREDGWMGASFAMDDDFEVTNESPLVLRYMLHPHAGSYDASRAGTRHKLFSARPGFQIRKPVAGEKHRQYEVERLPSAE